MGAAEGLAVLEKKSGTFRGESEGLLHAGKWNELYLWNKAKQNTANCRKTPKTCRIIEGIPHAATCTRGQVKFSVMTGKTHIWPHVGITNSRIRLHLALQVPAGRYLLRAGSSK